VTVRRVFYLRGRHDAARLIVLSKLVYGALAVVFLPTAVLLGFLAAIVDDWTIAVVITICLLFPFVALFAFTRLRVRIENAQMVMNDEALTIRGDWPDVRVPIQAIVAVGRSKVRLGDMLRASGWSPWNGTLFDLRYGRHTSREMIRLALYPSVGHPVWPPFAVQNGPS
jgi:hypothetical protein